MAALQPGAIHRYVGSARATILTAGHLLADVAAWLEVDPAGLPAPWQEALSRPQIIPMQCVHLALPGRSVLVDAFAYDLIGDSGFAVPGYEPPPSLSDQLRLAGIRPEAISDLIITHAHFDHFNGAATAQAETYTPVFPQAQVYIGRPDWNMNGPNSDLRQTLGCYEERNQLILVDGDHPLGDGLTLLATPGESPGHQVVRLRAPGETLYCLGDLYHHPLEAARPGLSPPWADTATLHLSRARLRQNATADQALLVAAHIAGLGRFSPAGWEVVK